MTKIDYRIVLLRCYRYLQEFIEQANFSIYNRALGTHNFCAEVREDTYVQVAAIIKLINQKNQLCAIRDIVVKGLNKLSEKKRTLLIFRYIKKYDSTKIMQKLDLCKGAYYARLKRALDEFEAIITQDGYDYAWFCTNYAGKVWFKKMCLKSSECQLDT